MVNNDWAVFRLDFAGNEFLVEKNLTEERARKRVAEFEALKHHQHYWCAKLPDTSVDFVQLLRDSLKSGSSLDASLGVLRNQGANRIDCVKAVREVQGIGLRDAKELVFLSPAFADQLESHNALVDQIVAALESENDE